MKGDAQGPVGGPATAAPPSSPSATQLWPGESGSAEDQHPSQADSHVPITRATLIRAFTWSSGGTTFSYVLAFIRSIVLARLLYPEDFGLFGLAVSFLTTAQMLTEFSLSQKILVTAFATKHEEQLYINTVWTAELIRRGLLSALILLAAYPASVLFRESRLTWILPIIALVPVLTAVQNPGLIRLRKALAFRLLAVQSQVPAATAFLATVFIAYFTRNYIALIASLLIESVLGIFLSYRLCTHRPQIIFEKQAFLDCFHFGKYLFVMALLTWFTTQLDQFVIARYLGPGVLGTYLLSQRLATLPVNLLSGAVSPVLLPAYGRLYGEDSERLVGLFRRTSVVATTGLVLISGLMALLSEPLIALLYGAKWSAAAPLLGVLAFAGMFRALSHTLSPLLLASNRPGLDAKLKVVDSAIFVSGLFILVPHYGAYGAALVGVTSYAVAFLLRVYYAVEAVSAGWALRCVITRPLWVGAGTFALAHTLIVPRFGVFAGTAAFFLVFLVAIGLLEPQLRRDAWTGLNDLLLPVARIPLRRRYR